MKSQSGNDLKRRRRNFKKIAAAKENLKKAVAASKGRASRIDWVRLSLYKANRVSGMNRFQAALKAGYSYTNARHNSCHYDRLAKLDIQQALEEAGATNQIQARELVNIAFNATKRHKCTVHIRQDGDEVVIDDQAAEDVPDLHLRKDTWELIAKLKGQLKQSAVIPEGDFKRLIVVVDRGSPESEPTDQCRQSTVDAASRIGVEVPLE